MKIIGHTGDSNLATVFIAEDGRGRSIEFLESVQPPLPREKKWVLIVSSLFGCPVRCPICDAGDHYKGRLSRRELFFQIDYLIERRYPDHIIPAEKFKIQFARMGEPAYNENVIDVLYELPQKYAAPGLMPCISTVAPLDAGCFFEHLLKVKKKLYDSAFQLQFSIHTTDTAIRDKLIPIRKWNFDQIAEYGEDFYTNGSRQITLNFALIKGVPVDPTIIAEYFDPLIFFIKLTPLNPTYSARNNGLFPGFNELDVQPAKVIAQGFRDAGFNVLISFGEIEENKIGSNCGQYVSRHIDGQDVLERGYGCRVINPA